MKSFTQVIATILFVGFVQANPPNFDYDFIGFTKLTQMLATSCDDIEGQIISHVGGIQKPTHNYAHIQCAADENMGHRIKFIIHRDEDDDAITGDTTKQRHEMYTTKGRGDLHASEGSTFIYAWWFFLSSAIVADTSFWHIFQIKPSGEGVDTNPTLTFTLKSNYGLHAELFEDHHGSAYYHEMLSLDEAKGQWIQAFVKINYATGGYADITLKGLTGNELYHQKLSGNFWWDNADYYGPKWGLYRRKSDIFNDSDFIFFQNVQIWRN